MTFRFLVIALILSIADDSTSAFAQCFASAGNPVGGTESIGTLDARLLRLQTAYRFSYSDRYYEGVRRYRGGKGILHSAHYNYVGWMTGYGIKDWLNAELEAGYFINKTQRYKVNDYQLRGSGASNIVANLKQRLFFYPSRRVEFSASIGSNIPFSCEQQTSDGVVLPIDVQPSTGSYGLVLQTFFVKENSFNAWRFFWVNRVEKYFVNRQGYFFGTVFTSSVFASKHLVIDRWKLKDWTLIMQIRNSLKLPNHRDGQEVKASGSFVVFIVPQINLSLPAAWNISLMGDLPVLQHYNEIQLGTSFLGGISASKDIQIGKYKQHVK